jgi:hypothetical protein
LRALIRGDDTIDAEAGVLLLLDAVESLVKIGAALGVRD